MNFHILVTVAWYYLYWYRALTTFKLEGELTGRSGRQQREVGRHLGEVGRLLGEVGELLGEVNGGMYMYCNLPRLTFDPLGKVMSYLYWEGCGIYCLDIFQIIRMQFLGLLPKGHHLNL